MQTFKRNLGAVLLARLQDQDCALDESTDDSVRDRAEYCRKRREIRRCDFDEIPRRIFRETLGHESDDRCVARDSTLALAR